MCYASNFVRKLCSLTVCTNSKSCFVTKCKLLKYDIFVEKKEREKKKMCDNYSYYCFSYNRKYAYACLNFENYLIFEVQRHPILFILHKYFRFHWHVYLIGVNCGNVIFAIYLIAISNKWFFFSLFCLTIV